MSFWRWALVILAAAASASTAHGVSPIPGAAANPPVTVTTWPPQLRLDMRVAFDPTPFPSGGRAYLTYELYISNFESQPITLRRVEVLEESGASVRPAATFEAQRLNPILHHMGQEIVGDYIPAPEDDSQRQLAAGETVVVYLNISFADAAQVPPRLRHRLLTDRGSVEGASLSSRRADLHVLAPPLQGNNWLVDSGPGNDSHHRREILVLNGVSHIPSRYAIDWRQLKNGKAFSGDEHSNRSYYAYGKSVLAVADAQVVAVKDDIPENTPGHFGTGKLAVPMSLDTICGNMIVLDLGRGQFAFYDHLQPKSLHVKVGDRVQRGQVLAAVGDSGGSFEPHLHFEVTTRPDALAGEGLPYILDQFSVTMPDRSGLDRRTHELPLNGQLLNF